MKKTKNLLNSYESSRPQNTNLFQKKSLFLQKTFQDSHFGGVINRLKITGLSTTKSKCSRKTDIRYVPYQRLSNFIHMPFVYLPAKYQKTAKFWVRHTIIPLHHARMA